MNDKDAERAGLRPEDRVEFTVAGSTYRVALTIRPDLPQGLAGIPAGIEPLQGIQLPAWSRIVRAA